MLRWLDKANLFLIPLDQEQHWYRYHALFKDFLLRSLRDTQTEAYIGMLHRRVALWYEQHNLMNEAVHHMLTSGDFERAAELIERIARSVWMRGEALTLQHWLQMLPEDLLHARPQLSLFFVWSLIASNQIEKAQQRLEEVMANSSKLTSSVSKEAQLSAINTAIQAEIIILQATLARFLNDVPRTLALSQQALEYLPQKNSILKSINMLNLGHAYRLRGDAEAASKILSKQ